jgi:signal transduction histidine kinase
MPRFRSIISRIISLHVLAIGVTSVALPLALYGLLSSTATKLQHGALREHADSIARYLEAGPDGGWRLALPSGLSALYSESYGRYGFAVIDPGGAVLFSSLPGGEAVLPADPRTPEPIYFRRRVDQGVFDGASIPEEVDGRRLWVEVAEDLAHRDVLIDDIVADFFTRVGWITVPILLFLLAIDIVIFRRALRPVLVASDLARSIGPLRMDLRLPTRDMPREILPLVHAVNQALDRLEGGFRALREFTADAAHELRTPLAVLRTRLDTMVADQGVARALTTDIDGMTRIVNQLLDIAELETFVVDPAETTDLQQVSSDVVAFLAPLALAKGKAIARTGEDGPVMVRGSAELVFQAVRNLAENAIAHTGAGSTVEVEVGTGGTVRVLDRGPGVPPRERPLIFRRFWRRDRHNAGGAGLGLAIVARIVAAHGGSIEVEDREGGGAVFTLALPRA